MTTQCKNTINKPTGIAPAACEIEWSELLHVTGDHSQVYCLTHSQMQEIIKEEQAVSKPIKELTEAYGQPNEKIVDTKHKTWDALKKEKLIPPLKPSDNIKPVEKYKFQHNMALERYKRQVKRKRRISNDCHVIDSELVHGLLSGPTRQFYGRYLASLQRTKVGLSKNLTNLELIYKQKEQLYDDEISRIKQLPIAVEHEVDFRVAQQITPPASAERLQQLREKANESGKDASLISYVSESELQNIVRIEVRLIHLEKEIESSSFQMFDKFLLKSLFTLDKRGRKYKKATQSLEQTEELQDKLYAEKNELTIEKGEFYKDLSGRPLTEAVTQMNGQYYAHQLIEIKRTGSQGFKYIRRDTLEQLKKNWQKLNMSDVKKALKPTLKGLEGAARQAGKELSENRAIKLKFADWKTDEDHFLNQLNKELFKVSLNGDVSPEDKQFDASAEAQLFRFSAGAELAAEYDAKTGSVHVGGTSQVSYDLVKASVTTNICLPSEAGFEFKLSYQGDTGELKQLDYGYFRTQFNLTLEGSAGACAMLSSKVRIDTKPGELSVGGDMKGNAFAGGMLKNKASLAVQWAKPTNNNVKSIYGETLRPKFETLVKVEPSISVAFGIGAGVDFKVEYVRGKFVLILDAQLVCGPGGSGGVAVELSVEKIIELIVFIRDALEKSDFRFLEWVSKETFEVISKFTELYLSFEHTLEYLAGLDEYQFLTLWKGISVDQRSIKAECRNLLASSHRAKLVTPTSKARVLNRICTTYFFEEDSFSLDDDELQAEACMKLLGSIQSEREFIEILRLMGMDEGKGDSVIFLSNFNKVFNHLLYQSKQKEKAYHWLESIAFSSLNSLE